MSINGIGRTLFVRRSCISIMGLLGNTKDYYYDNIKMINYCYAENGKAGYLKISTNTGAEGTFKFSENVNDKISQTISYLQSYSNIKIENKKGIAEKVKAENQGTINLKLKALIHPKDLDDLFQNSGEIILKRNNATLPLLQRTLKIGYFRAEKIMDQLVDCGVIGKQEGIQPRKILTSLEEFEYFVSNYESLYDPLQVNDVKTKDSLADRIQLYNNKYDYMEGHDFEYFCAQLLERNGFENVNVTQGSGDQGIDIIAFKDKVKYGIQCKCYSSDIGNKAIQEAFSGARFYDCHVPVVLTNRHFTKSALQLAEKINVLLWDREKLDNLINASK